MPTKLFIVKVKTADHYDDLLDSFGPYLVYAFAGTAFTIMDVQEKESE